MNPLDKAKALKQLYDRYGSYDRVARESNWSVQTIRKYMKLLELPQSLQDQIGTSNGAVGVGTFARLADFKGDEAVQVYDRIAGFNNRVQVEILKQAKGDIATIDDLVDEAHEGIFDVRRCGGSHGCQVIQEILDNQMAQRDFEKSVEAAAVRRRASDLECKRMKEAAWAFWKALATGDDPMLAF